MKKRSLIVCVLFLFSMTITAQKNYQKLWDKVLKFEKDNLPKSALQVVDEIYKKAEKAKNTPQIIKALFHKSKYALTLEENAQLKIVNQFKEHIAKSEFPTKNVLENILANLYWQYFNQNRWRFYDRTNTENKVDPNDFRTWDVTTLFNEIHTYYKASLQNGLLLQQEDIRDFKDILHIAKNSTEYRPTLFDLLAHNALAFYKTNETHITQPVYQFKLDNPKLLSDAKTFSRIYLTTKDKTSLQFNALKVYQELIAFHVKDKDPKALADVDLNRLQFVRKHATFTNKDELYLQALKTNENRYKNNEVSGLYAFEIARTYHEQANLYNPRKNTTHQFKNKEALAICKKVIQQFPESLGAKKCTNLQQQITAKMLSILTEEYTPIDTYTRALVYHKNVDELYFSIYKITLSQKLKLDRLYEDHKRVDFIHKLKKITSWKEAFKNESDYQQHSTEIVIPKLVQGSYLITTSEKKEINKNETYGTAHIQATNLTFITNYNDKKNTYQVVDRNTGKPLANSSVTLSNKPYQRYGDKLHRTFTTDTHGEFEFTPSYRKYYNNVYASVTHKDDKATFGSFYINGRHRNTTNDRVRIRSFVFTDRSIYRPGQTVYFKGISMETFKNKSTLKTDELVFVTLKDVNGQKLQELELTTNEFGSFSGNFILPNTGLTGNYSIITSIDTSRDHIGISVEEYKRPKFETAFKPVTKSYRINDKITVDGFAKAFSGATITDAKVVYRVRRKVVYPRWCFWYRPIIVAEPQEIVHGETTTDDKGNFSIPFTAIPDESVDKTNQPIFTYEVTADVTDINGETRSTSTTVRIGYHAMTASVTIDDVIHTDEKNQTIKITTENLNGEFVPATGTITIYKLQAPTRILRKRPWHAPDYQMISESDFISKFPHDAYTDEDNPKNWKKGAVVFTATFDTGKEKEINLKNSKKWMAGSYVIELDTRDAFNQKVTDKQLFTVANPKEKLPTDNQLLSITTDKDAYEIGDKAVVTVSTNSNDVTVMVRVEKAHKIIRKEYIHLNKNSKQLTIPVTKKDEGGFGVRYYLVNYNSFKNGNLLVNVPYPKTELDISTKTFRDKLAPGENQTWSFVVKGAKKDKVTAELLAGMYDASLDQFKRHQWNFNPIYKPLYFINNNVNANESFSTTHFTIDNLNDFQYENIPHQNYDRLNWFGFRLGYVGNMYAMAEDAALEEVVVTGVSNKRKKLRSPAPAMMKGSSIERLESDASEAIEEVNDEKALSDGAIISEEKTALKGIQIRKNLQETAFFYPHLTTDKNGNVQFNFTVPEALTKWKLQLLAHTKELHSAIKTLETVTQKELMVTPNAPRFLREGDHITLRSKISNLSDKKLQGIAQLILTDAITGKEINLFSKSTSSQNFTVDTEGNTNVSWDLSIPDTIQAVQYKVIAKAGDFSDGEQNALPVLSNRMLVTETLPMWVRSNQTKTFRLDKLAQQPKTNNQKQTLKHHKLTLEVTSNPAWYAVQALPYLMEYPHECSEQTFSRYYANTLATHIANSNPKIQEVFNQWKSSDALLSNLEKNQELKSLLIQETPWLRDAQSETEQKKRIALLFDLNTLKNEQSRTIKKLQNIQMSNGGFPWFKGGRYPNPYITQYIASGFGHLQKLGITNIDNDTKKMIKGAVRFSDDELVEIYQKLLERARKIRAKEGKKAAEKFLAEKHIGYFQLQYLYMRSFYPKITINKQTQKAIDYYKQQSETYWNDFNLLGKGQIALLHHRTGNKAMATKVLQSLKENSITSDELGMYWKANTPGYFNYQAPIETQALLIEAFSEIENDTKTIDNLKIWLLKNKQVSQWKTTKATSEAVYALLLQGSDWISVTDMVDVQIGSLKIEPSKRKDIQVEAGTGYFKTSWNTNNITPKMAEVTLSKKGKGIAWGGLYWQYFEDLDKITSAQTPLKLKKKLFLKVNSDTGKKLKEVTDKTTLKVGDLLTVRIELRSDRAMEFIHMKDMRASGVEPINVLSQYKWQDGLGYYESTKDAATNFFFDYLPKGVYVFEYDVRVNNAGDFSNGITTIQSMYAPEFSSHSEGIRIKVKTK